MTTLITGATGLLGNNVLRDLLATERPVRILSRAIKRPKALEGLVFEAASGDISEPDVVRKAMQGIELVIHCAGQVHIGWSQREEHQRVNVEGTRNVAQAALENGARMVYVSSVNALGIGARDFEADEETARPGIVECPYVITKRAAEEVVLDLVEKGLNAVIVNPGFMLGPWDWRPSSGRMVIEISTRFAPLAPKGSFNVCDVRDVSAGTLAAAEKGKAGRHYILGGHNVSYFELWKLISAVAGKRGPIMPAGPMQRAIGALYGDFIYRITGREPDLNSAGVAMSSQHHRFKSDRAIAELGYKIRPLNETLHDAFDWFIAYGYLKPKPSGGVAKAS